MHITLVRNRHNCASQANKLEPYLSAAYAVSIEYPCASRRDVAAAERLFSRYSLASRKRILATTRQLHHDNSLDTSTIYETRLYSLLVRHRARVHLAECLDDEVCAYAKVLNTEFESRRMDVTELFLAGNVERAIDVGKESFEILARLSEIREDGILEYLPQVARKISRNATYQKPYVIILGRDHDMAPRIAKTLGASVDDVAIIPTPYLHLEIPSVHKTIREKIFVPNPREHILKWEFGNLLQIIFLTQKNITLYGCDYFSRHHPEMLREDPVILGAEILSQITAPIANRIASRATIEDINTISTRFGAARITINTFEEMRRAYPIVEQVLHLPPSDTPDYTRWKEYMPLGQEKSIDSVVTRYSPTGGRPT